MPVFKSSIKRELTRVYDVSKPKSKELSEMKWILLSDHHRGQKDRADDFLQCMPAYHAALRYYYDEGYTLFLLGDVEELWECFPTNALNAYRETLKMEKAFADDNRLFRFWGNHDDLWSYPKKVNKYLKDYIGDINVEEGLNIDICRQGKPLGRLFLLHGHQGSFFNDRIKGISRFVVRFFWRNIQRVFGFKSTTSSNNFEIKTKREKTIYNWMNEKNQSNELNTVLIAGDTHMPVFASKTHIAALQDDIADLKEKLSRSRKAQEKKEIIDQIRLKSFELDKVIADNPKASEDKGYGKPCYFNTGTCSFSDGDITGIEISGEEIRLVRWPDKNGDPKKIELRKEDINKIFSNC